MFLLNVYCFLLNPYIDTVNKNDPDKPFINHLYQLNFKVLIRKLNYIKSI